MKKVIVIIICCVACLSLFIYIGGGIFSGKFFNKDIPAKPGSLEAYYSAEGPYKVEYKIVEADEKPAYIYYYPVDGPDKLPVILFGNGSYSDPETYTKLMEHFATHGFLVIDNYNKVTGTGFPIIENLNKLKEEATSGNVILEKADFDNIGLVGHSQGATGVINAHTNYKEGSIFKTIISVSLPALKWCEPEDKYDMTKIKVPIMILTGTLDKYISPENKCLEALYSIPDDVNGIMLNALGTGHLEFNGDGGKYRGVMTAWFYYYLKGDEEGGSLFYGQDAEIYSNPGWKTVKYKKRF